MKNVKMRNGKWKMENDPVATLSVLTAINIEVNDSDEDQ
jgi:hypothetical protein